MAHPHPDPHAHPGAQYLDPVAPEPESPTRRRVLVGVALASVVVIAAVLLMWQATASKDTAQRAAAAASRACRQVEGLGQKCATAGPEEEQAAPAQAVIPEGPGSLAPLPGAPSGSSGAPEETAAQAGQPGGPMVNPGDDRIVGLTVRGGRLEVTYADGSAVDAGRVEGAPPPIVLIVPSPAADGRGPNGTPAEVPTGPSGSLNGPDATPEPTVSLPVGNDGPDPNGTGPQDPQEPQDPQQTYVP